MRNVILILLLLQGSSVAAQNEAQPPTTAMLDEATVRPDPSLRSALSTREQSVAVTATKGTKTASIKVADYLVGRTTDLWHITLSGPLSDAGDQTDLASFHGISSTATLEFGLQSRTSTAHAVISNPSAVTGPAWDELCRKYKGTTDCDPYALPRFERDRMIRWSGITQWVSANFSYGSQSFDFLNSADLKKESERQPTYSATGAYSFLPLWHGIYVVTIDFRYVDGHKSQPKNQICLPLATGSAALQCITIALGAPKRETTRALEAEARWYAGASFAAVPFVSYNRASRTTQVELPLYFIRDDHKGLDGGIAIGWSSGSKQLTAAVFVGSVLKSAALTR